MWKRAFSLLQANRINMQILRTIRITQQMMSLTREQGKTIGFVPTMGSLHQGHLSLIEAAKRECDMVVVSIFVNPTQFSEGEDFAAYPRDFEKDKLALERAEVDYLFYPEASEVYPVSDMVGFKLPNDLTDMTCGKFRHGHFEGVAQVCAKFFNIIKPHKVYFGQKDYQQTLVIKRLIEDLNFGIELRICPTVREQSGLAMSSRNKYLKDLDSAVVLSKALFAVRDAYKTGERDEVKLIDVGMKVLANEPRFLVQYFEIHDGVAALAGYIGKTRLIDNVILES
ncbi:MAG: pantoate-beta-alanine ligase [uncultured bacterium]|nr:MAG: pantoate-beta-alanine ligase [uncultured bacterium]